MQSVLKFSKLVFIPFRFYASVLVIAGISLSFFRCGSILEFRTTGDIQRFSDNYASQIFFVSNPFVSPYYSSGFQARYIILHNHSGKEEMIQGILKYLELSGKSDQLERILLEVVEWKGPFTRSSNDRHKIEFIPKTVSKRSEISYTKALPEIQNPNPKIERIDSLKREFAISEEGAIREIEESRIIPGIGTLRWRHTLRGILAKVMQTEFIGANGAVSSSRDYDYESMEYPASIGLTKTIPILTIRKTESHTDYYCLDLPSDTDLQSLRKNEMKKSVSFYDLTANKPFTAMANFKNYPIIRISNEKVQTP
ncbi:hypothetical protein AB3N59_17470 [Leptospira sp. WS92.C1]